MQFFTAYIVAVVLLLIYFGLIVKFEGTEGLTRGWFIAYMTATFVPVLNFFAAGIASIMMVGYLCDRYKVGKWLSKPLIKPKE